MKRHLVIIQARMGSERFPGKSLYEFQGKPSLYWVIESLRQCIDRDCIFVATSRLKDDDKIADFCNSISTPVFRGAELDVALRFRNLCEKFHPDFFIRVSGDSPLLDYRVVREAKAIYEQSAIDIVCSMQPYPHPSGMNVEVVKTELFLREYPNFSKPDHFEHVTKYFYEKDKSFAIQGIPCPIADPGSYKFSFDTAEDCTRIERIFSAMKEPHYNYSLEDKCRMYRELFLKAA